jgi:hypothetical protein
LSPIERGQVRVSVDHAGVASASAFVTPTYASRGSTTDHHPAAIVDDARSSPPEPV